MTLPYDDPSLVSGAAPIFTDVSAVRGDQLRANNGSIWGNLQHLDDYMDYGTYYITTQAQFDAIIEEVSGNQWQFIDAVRSVIFSYLAGGYQMDDDDDYLETNNCKSIEMRGGAFIDFNAGIGYLSINTNDCYLRNVDVQGNGSSGAVVQSYLLNAYRVIYDNCKCSNRLSSVDMVGFQGSGTAAHNITSKYINCSAYALDGADKVYGFKDCYNLQNCLAYDIDGTGDWTFGFYTCQQLSTCIAYDIDNTALKSWGFYLCKQMSACQANNINSSGDAAYGYSFCEQISGCRAELITSSADIAQGFDECYQITGCIADDIDTTSGTGSAYGFEGCQAISGCRAIDVDADSGDAYGFNACYCITSCFADDIDSVSATAYGFRFITYGAALYTNEPNNTNTDWIDSGDAQITNQYSCPAIWT